MSRFPADFNKKQRFDSLTGIRGIAACWVVVFHIRGYLGINHDSWLWSLLEKGYLAVDLFFILSGFVIYLTYGHQFGFQKMKPFLIKRLARIYPLHIIVLLCSLSLPFAIYFFSSKKIVTNNFSAESFVANVFLYQSWGWSNALSWNVPAWSISAEWFSYLSFCGLAFFYKKLRQKTMWLSLILIIAICMLIAFVCKRMEYVSIGQDINHFAIYRCLLQFMLGNLLAVILLREGVKIPKIISVLFIVTAATLFFQVTYRGIADYFVMPLAFCLFIAFLVTSNGWLVKLLECKLFMYLGDISYSIYLWHYFIRDWFKVFFVHNTASVDFRYLIAYFIVLIVLSDFSYRHFETTLKRKILCYSSR